MRRRRRTAIITGISLFAALEPGLGLSSEHREQKPGPRSGTSPAFGQSGGQRAAAAAWPACLALRPG